MVEAGLAQAKRLILLLGSCNAPRSRKNPWSFEERVEMIQSALPTEIFRRLDFLALNDYPDDGAWQQQVKNVVSHHLPANANFALMGHHKDESSYYLKLFPDWTYVDFPSMGEISATPIREAYFATAPTKRFEHPDLAPQLIDWLNDFRKNNPFTQ